MAGLGIKNHCSGGSLPEIIDIQSTIGFFISRMFKKVMNVGANLAFALLNKVARDGYEFRLATVWLNGFMKGGWTFSNSVAFPRAPGTGGSMGAKVFYGA